MKFKIFGTILVLVILIVLYALFNSGPAPVEGEVPVASEMQQ